MISQSLTKGPDKLDKMAREKGSDGHRNSFVQSYLPDMFVKAAVATRYDSSQQDHLVSLLRTLQQYPQPGWNGLLGHGFSYKLSDVYNG